MPAFSVITFGCQMNSHDSERLSEVLTGAGYWATEKLEEADVVLLNTCSVREKAEQKLRSEVGRLGLLKRERPGLLIGVAGCVAQQEGERLIKTLPQIDIVIGPDNIAELPTLLARAEAGSPPQVRTEFDLDAPEFLQARPEAGKVMPSAFVTVMKGCDERCSYCVVPYTRGPERYRPSREILDEIERLVLAGVKEVTLLGQTVNSYRDPSGSLPAAPPSALEFRQAPHLRANEAESEFPALLHAIARQVPGLLRLRYTSPHPRHLTARLISAHTEIPILAKHVHMPVQSGSDRLLKKMIRRYSAEEYLERITALRDSVPGMTLSTDVIVGFPGETLEDFQATLELVEKVGFVGLFGFKYSPRPHTPSLKLEDDVPEPEKARRLAELFDVVERARIAHLTSLIGTTQQVLVEGLNQRGGYTGRTERNEIVHFWATTSPVGEVCEVRILRAFKNSLAAELVEPTRHLPWQDQKTKAQLRALPVM
ncbi:MAG: MiaB/RimO family radical SAM methylthiotransferase [Polyangiaceae bacterium]|nr:MiaB/RimO family radical SAM methylthiotransferase [Polyangiaceae bacterium]